ncbi:hypothetical protein chiPu_0019941 [Chiloscyllium punctatum]|uniref:CAF17 C-terminal domain-containing protein n=1 Tax=Chiloscyllium punctatum TaxID=137246 RepID=A0A401RTJ2_CHIPU|nr:hypothetical protein [Chiloscyllium punctatum]
MSGESSIHPSCPAEGNVLGGDRLSPIPLEDGDVGEVINTHPGCPAEGDVLGGDRHSPTPLQTTMSGRLHKSQNEEPSILLECDATLLDAIQKHFKVYKIRRKVEISPCPELSLWTVLSLEQSAKAGSALEVDAKKVVVCTRDPRTDAMGWRLVLSKVDDPLAVVLGSHLGDIQDYHRYRYQIGIAEGVKDLPSGEAIPLESNLVYMNGISFTKGCYIGQELTARTHYTGVIRKRLMPIQLDNPLPPGSVPEKAQIVTESGKSAGRLRNYTGDVGLAMVRLAFANEPLHLRTKGDAQVSLKASAPDWWPTDENK